MSASNFNRFFSEYVANGESKEAILFNFLTSFVSEVSDEWDSEVELSSYRSSSLIEESKPLFEVNRGVLVITANGNVYKVKTKTKATGDQTWNGDDVYYNNIATTYFDCERLGQVIGFSCRIKDLTSDKMENIACELVSIVSDHL